MQAPTSVTVFGIINILFGLLGIFGTAFTAVVIFAAPDDAVFVAGPGPFLETWLRVSMVLGCLASIALVISGIGLLRMRSWGHKLAIAYAIYAVASTILGLAIQVFFVVLPQVQQPRGGRDAVPVLAGAIGGLLGGCVALAYPVLLWYFMTRPNVVAAFGGAAPPEEPLELGDATAADYPAANSSNPYASPRSSSAPVVAEVVSGQANSVVDALIPSKNGPALASYYLGLFSLMPCLGFPLGVAAVYLGVKGLKNVRANPVVRGGAHAWVGVICGSLFGLFNLLLLIGAVVAGVVAATTR